MYDYIIVTHIPNFYKVNLYNELSKNLKILVLFTAKSTSEKRSDDFITLDKSEFEYRLLYDGNYEERNVLANILSIRKILKESNYKRILVSGWDTKEDWYSVFSNIKAKNCLALESTINESSITGIKGVLKKLFLSRISRILASGSLHNNLLEKLNYNGEVKITRGVGIINKPDLSIFERQYNKRYVFIGRLSREKNIEMLIDTFNNLQDYTLTVIGTGPLENELKNKAKKNIIFSGKVANKNIKNNLDDNDILILPSISETWGLVVEEALYFGIPSIVSSNCGVSELIKDNVNGFIFNPNKPQNIKNIIEKINNQIYLRLLDGVSKCSLNDKDLEQVRSYDIN